MTIAFDGLRHMSHGDLLTLTTSKSAIGIGLYLLVENEEHGSTARVLERADVVWLRDQLTRWLQSVAKKGTHARRRASPRKRTHPRAR